MTKKMDDSKLLKLAEAELLGEAKRAAIRHSIAGPSGWQPCPKANKCFLINTLLQTISSNRLMSQKAEKRRKRESHPTKRKERKLLQKSEKTQHCNFIYKKPELKQTVKETVHSKKRKKVHRVDRNKSVKHKKRKKSVVENDKEIQK